MAQINNLNHRHQQIINWLILNPDKTLGDCAAFFGYTQPWLTQIIHSDMFQAAYGEACKSANTLAVHTIVNELSGLTAITIAKAKDTIVAGKASERFLGETLSTCLAGLGYKAGGRGQAQESQPQLHVHVSAQDLLEARERAAMLKEGTAPAKLTQVVDVLPEPARPQKSEVDLLMEELNGSACAA